jgi:two-component system chemotaxis sensor kinase CheA
MVKDPYKYFRIEARELVDGLEQGALDLEKGHSSKDAVARMLRFAHTLKGAARVVKLVPIADMAHAVEDLLAPYREGDVVVVPREQVDALLRLLDTMDAALGAIETRTAPDAHVAGPVAPVETVRVEVDEMDSLLEGVAEAHAQLGTLKRSADTLERAHRIASAIVEQLDRTRGETTLAHRNALGQLRADLARLTVEMGGSIEQVGVELAQVRDAANRLRLTPVATVFASVERAARDAAQALGKRVELKASGGETRLDAHVLASVSGALLHLARNAVAHGIETSSDRIAAGKPAVGAIELHAVLRGDRVVFVCRDDGRGIDVDALRRAARDRGAEATDDLFELMLRAGSTTSANVTHLAGRGIGLDVVRETIEKLKGEVRVTSEPRAGTTFELLVPVSLSARPSLLLRAGDVIGSLPLEHVRRTLRVAPREIARDQGGDSIVFESKVIPFAPLARLLGRGDAVVRRAAWSAVVVQSGATLAAIGVDRFLGTANVVARRVPVDVGALEVVAGTSLDAEGNPELVFDADSLVAHARDAHGAREGAPRTRAPILVIDDSLTTRMLEQSILESAGYDVELATSAEEGLEMARAKRYGVFVVDVEMPGMDGFEFVTRTRADVELREVPAILVTSRAAKEDLERGRAAGAHAYIVKGEFDQAHLLDTIRELVG